jgi:anti-anti-sigma factor
MKRDELAHLISDVSKLGARVRVSLDFRDVNTMTASALGKLLILKRTVRALGGRFVLRNINPMVSDVFRATHLDSVFDGLARKNKATPARSSSTGTSKKEEDETKATRCKRSTGPASVNC